MSDILIGTSGYDYPEWKGVFYPKNFARKNFLSYYATKFNAVELNNTFYNMPTADRMKGFYDRSEGRLFFSVKANRLLTHEIDLNWKTAATDFQVALALLSDKGVLSAVLFQLPQSFHYTPDNCFYLDDLLKTFEELPTVVEFRHKEWIRPSVFEGLDKRWIGIVFCDMPKLRDLPNGLTVGEGENRTPFTGSQAYIRLHGRNANAWYAHRFFQIRL